MRIIEADTHIFKSFSGFPLQVISTDFVVINQGGLAFVSKRFIFCIFAA